MYSTPKYFDEKHEKQRAIYAKNRDCIVEYQRNYYATHKYMYKEYRHTYYMKNRVHEIEKASEWRIRHQYSNAFNGRSQCPICGKFMSNEVVFITNSKKKSGIKTKGINYICSEHGAWLKKISELR